jgi:hypothetical protein
LAARTAERRGIDALTQAVGDLQNDVFFARAGRAHGTRVFAAVAGVQRNDDQPVGFAAFDGCRGCWTAGFLVYDVGSPRQLAL